MTQLVDWDKPLEDEFGNPARLLSKNFQSGTWHNLYVVQVNPANNDSVIRYYYHDGTPRGNECRTIRNKKEKREGWVNVYYVGSSPNKHLKTGMQIYKSEQAAADIGKFHNLAENRGLPMDKRGTMQHRTYIATVKIEVEV